MSVIKETTAPASRHGHNPDQSSGRVTARCASIGTGTCAIAAYNQSLADELVAVDGNEELTVYIAPVGKVTRK